MEKISIRKIQKFGIVFIFIVSMVVLKFINHTSVSTESNKITIFHTNDMHGALDSCYTQEGKLIQIGVDVIKSLKERTPNSILLDAGDATQGGIVASSSQGSKVIELMNEAGYDIMCLGNHEFDYGLDALKLNAALAKFKMLSSNTYGNNGGPLLETEHSNGCNTIINMAGKSIGVFALTTDSAQYTTHPKNVEDVAFMDPMKSTKQQCEYLKNQGADIIVLIAHIGTTDPNLTTETIAEQFPHIDIIIDGHSHEVYSKTVGHTFIQQAGTKSKSIGKIEIEFTENNQFKLNHEIIKANDLINPLNPDIPTLIPDSRVAALCKDMIQQASESFNIIIGQTDCGLYGGEYQNTRISRLNDTNLGNLMADALVHYGQIFLNQSGMGNKFSIVSLQNGGGIRTSILPKFISIGHIKSVFPFPNRASIKIVTPSELYFILENGVKSLGIENGELIGPDGAFPSVGGMRVEFDINEKPLDFDLDQSKILFQGSRIKKIVLTNNDGSDGTTLNRNDNKSQIAFVTNTFESAGGDHYVMLKSMPSLTDDGKLLSEVLTDYIKFITFELEKSFSYPATLSRVKLIGSENLFKKYTAHIVVKQNSVELKNTDVRVSIDSTKDFWTHTDDRGIVDIPNLEQGPHDIKLSREKLYMNAYVNNRIGVTKAGIFLENTPEQDINNVINIINGIPNQKVAEMASYVAFARTSYESLDDEEKSLVINYKNLINSENALMSLNPSIEYKNNLYGTINKSHTIITIAILLVGTCITIYIAKNKARKVSAKMGI